MSSDSAPPPPPAVQTADRERVVQSLLRLTRWTYSHNRPADESRRTLVLLFLLCAVSGMVYGFTASLGGLLDPISADLDFVNSTTSSELLNSATLVGGLAFSPVAGVMGDRLGRIWTTLFCGVLSTAASVVSAVVNDFWFLCACRLVLGIGSTVICFIVPVYVAECAPAKSRGLLVAVFQLSINTGLALSYGVQLILSWRWALGVGAAPGLLVILLVAGWLPESPRYLLSKLAPQRARRSSSLSDGHGAIGSSYHEHDNAEIDGDGDDDEAEDTAKLLGPRSRIAAGHTPQTRSSGKINRHRNIQASSLQLKNDDAGGEAGVENQQPEDDEIVHLSAREFFSLLSVRSVMLGFMLCILNNSVQGVVSYGPQIFKAAGYSNDDGVLAATIAGGVSIVLSLISLPVIHHCSRRFLLVITALGVTIGTLVMAAGFQFLEPGSSRLGLLITGQAVTILAFQMGVGPLFFVVVPEIFPQRIRGAANGMLSLLLALCSLIITITFLSSIDAVGVAGTFLYYGLLFFLCFLGVWRFLPETANVVLEHISV
ncbi:sugar transporter [Capsaspora owczarzaki ATCC 30864]|uniref:Sugar transporter n=1 Tax=Capsaspora owczarzaki (strain ATCC 30864) TaxID=595528 RepID=A0A0D2UN33_CAPO3|nr:sugar transporter [Capsaspora owczarzaki ATCC 30864]KJE96441.1 sugar transporter [Capsaspora owczarzaki ATCC 30864]|eukprot:XP_004344387.1 sugar transporter [Capsaspora owczarzaki ATCC 30864]